MKFGSPLQYQNCRVGSLTRGLVAPFVILPLLLQATLFAQPPHPKSLWSSVCPRFILDFIQKPELPGPTLRYRGRHLYYSSGPPPILTPLPELQDPRVVEILEYLDLPESGHLYISAADWADIQKNPTALTVQAPATFSDRVFPFALTFVSAFFPGSRFLRSGWESRRIHSASREPFHRIPIWYLNHLARAIGHGALDQFDRQIAIQYALLRYFKGIGLQFQHDYTADEFTPLPFSRRSKQLVYWHLKNGGKVRFEYYNHMLGGGVLLTPRSSNAELHKAYSSTRGCFSLSTNTVVINPFASSLHQYLDLNGKGQIKGIPEVLENMSRTVKHEIAHAAIRRASLKSSAILAAVLQHFPPPTSIFAEGGAHALSMKDRMTPVDIFLQFSSSDSQFLSHQTAYHKLLYLSDEQITEDLSKTLALLGAEPTRAEGEAILATVAQLRSASDGEPGGTTPDDLFNLLKKVLRAKLDFSQYMKACIQLYRAYQLSQMVDEFYATKFGGGDEPPRELYPHFDFRFTWAVNVILRDIESYLFHPHVYREFIEASKRWR